MTATLKETFWNKMDKTHVVLLGANGGNPVPMSPLPREDDNAIWFITAADHDTFDAAKSGASADIYLSDSSGGIYGTIKGTLSASQDEDKLDELWSPMAAAWFENGREDDSVRLMKYTPSEAEIWSSDGNAKYLFETIKANVTDSTPDTGEYGTIHF
ncbi:pyridoxamine 5'-phosphate oxidase family protein [Marivita sp. XM-24bin2]|jgi:general stress protein 26|uniref:pyridoxamine 5'-phosphate oxidase family protein n=1 Tax=unclassified Marivita TaxID=2632480 RepID=UPI000D792FA9|nr:pyridoxamine 5'-phosphate oxidase family protein [Marivita sp. XM-24bin2]MCR9107584.1 pyridoxamine 5'-phosphate oxidase family protein [Paracoccaceae bacterium]PWL34848.1 MAG: general stress protein [Marivita sp. XM-24bin2]